MSEGLSEYELQRLEHIKRNHEMLVRLGLVDEAPKETPVAKDKKPRQRLPPSLPETLRRSARVKNEKPDYTREVIDTFGDELDQKCEPGALRRKRARADAEDDGEDGEDEERLREEINETTMAFLRDARDAMRRFLTSDDGDAPVSTDGWRDEAIRRWGGLAGGGLKATSRDWEAYVTSRLTKCPPPSPAPLLQEFYCHDMWQLLCVCVLMSRVSSWDTKVSIQQQPVMKRMAQVESVATDPLMRHRGSGTPPPPRLIALLLLQHHCSRHIPLDPPQHRCISTFFAAYPTPTAFMEQVIQQQQTASLREKINSLGLFDDRCVSGIGSDGVRPDPMRSSSIESDQSTHLIPSHSTPPRPISPRPTLLRPMPPHPIPPHPIPSHPIVLTHRIPSHAPRPAPNLISASPR